MGMIQAIDTDNGYQAFTVATARLGAKPRAFLNVGYYGSERAIKAASSEFGMRTIPERSFMRTAFDEIVPTLTKKIRRDAGRLVDGAKITPEQALLPAANDLRSAIIDKIITIRSPPNAPSTIAQKGSSNPLVDTGQMSRQIDIKPGTRSEAE